MTRLPAILFFVALTFLCWGTYGPVLHIGQELMEHSRWRPFICVGMAYFVIAVIVPWILMGRNDTGKGRWTMSGITWSFSAGIITAIGALGIILAFNFGGKPVYVMPLVFGCSPVVNTLVTMLMTGSHKKTRWPFYLAVLLVALGAAGVFIFKPKPVKAHAAIYGEMIETTRVLRAETDGEAAETDAKEENADEHDDADKEEPATEPEKSTSLFKVLLSVLTTVICWGSYGPLLHKGQVKMENCRLRPFICVGLAYFAIAVIVPIYILRQYGEPGHFGIYGTLWSLFAGALGALGSLGIILAFTSGGKPVYVMPLIFGMAPVINTLTSMSQSYLRSGDVGTISTPFIASLCLVIIGAVCVLIFAPKNPPPKPAATADEPAATKDDAADEKPADDDAASDGE